MSTDLDTDILSQLDFAAEQLWSIDVFVNRWYSETTDLVVLVNWSGPDSNEPIGSLWWAERDIDGLGVATTQLESLLAQVGLHQVGDWHFAREYRSTDCAGYYVLRCSVQKVTA